MNTTSLLIVLGMFVLPLPKVRAQTPARRPPAAVTTPTSSPSWLFLLETKTQWLLVLQDNSGAQDASGTGTLTSSSLAPNGNAGANEKSSSLRGLSMNASEYNLANSTTTGRNVETGLGDPSVFEGNTDMIPLEAPILPPSKSPFKPSAPDS